MLEMKMKYKAHASLIPVSQPLLLFFFSRVGGVVSFAPGGHGLAGTDAGLLRVDLADSRELDRDPGADFVSVIGMCL